MSDQTPTCECRHKLSDHRSDGDVCLATSPSASRPGAVCECDCAEFRASLGGTTEPREPVRYFTDALFRASEIVGKQEGLDVKLLAAAHLVNDHDRQRARITELESALSSAREAVMRYEEERAADTALLNLLESRYVYAQVSNDRLHGTVMFDIPRGMRLRDALRSALPEPGAEP